jgi:lysophospholipase L1-like esterase
VSGTVYSIGPLVTYNWNPSVQLKNLIADEAGVQAGDGPGATIALLGDSTTDGFGTAPANWIATTSLAAQLTAALKTDGVVANQADFMGQGNELAFNTDARVSLFGGSGWSFPMGAGGEIVGMSQVGAGVTFAPGSTAVSRSLTLDYYDVGGAQLTVSVNGQAIGTVDIGSTGLLAATTLTLPAAEIVTSVTVTDANGSSAYLEGVTLASATPSVQVVDAGVGGEESSAVGAGQPETTPYNSTIINAEAAQSPTVAFVDFGINDVLQGNLTAAQTTANLKLMVQELQAVGTEVVIVIPNPITAAGWATEIPTLRVDVYALAVQLNVGVIDLSATSADNAAALRTEGLLGADGVHPTAGYDAQVATQLAGLLTAPLAPPVTCFAPGTRIATPSGEVAVEHLRPGDPVLTASGRVRPVRWLGVQTVVTRSADPLRAWPIRIRAGALGENLPVRDLLLSPGHALLLDGVLVQASALVNGSTIARTIRVPEELRYHHVELDCHDLLLAEGTPAESFWGPAESTPFDNEADRPPPEAPVPLPYPRVQSVRQVPAAIRARLAPRPFAA